jgi:hypothetical protein
MNLFMKIRIAQTSPKKGCVFTNRASHKISIQHAAFLNERSIFFSEQSLSIYKPEHTKDLAMSLDDQWLEISAYTNFPRTPKKLLCTLKNP